jgi:hypothetical protein
VEIAAAGRFRTGALCLARLGDAVRELLLVDIRPRGPLEAEAGEDGDVETRSIGTAGHGARKF